MEVWKVQIDCGTCPVKGDACADCVVTVLLGPPELDAREGAALVVLADSGLVPPLRDPRVDMADPQGRKDRRPANRAAG